MINVLQIFKDRKLRPHAATAGSILLLLLIFVVWIFWWPNTFFYPSERTVTISRGASFNAVVDSLASRGIIGSRFAFKLAGRVLGWTTEMKVGKYRFTSGSSNLSILRDLKDGTSRILIPVAIPEGMRMRLIARRFAAELGFDENEFLNICLDTAFVREAGFQGASLEGYLLPDTYAFHWQTEPKEIVDKLVESFKTFYADSLSKRAAEMKMTLTEVITLASIVEGESQLADERAIIAGVYHNRLKKRMRLEADPTIQYILPDGPRRLLYEDLRMDSPYNTYRRYGLPPGPINNPGREAILAVLYPARHDYLFFVANGKGGHLFSRTYSDHQRAVRAYRKVRREMQRTANLGG